MCLVPLWTNDERSTTGNKKGMPQLSLSQEPNYLINTTTESSGADAEKSESTCRVWNCRGRQGRQWQGEIDVIACTFGHMSIHHGEKFAKGSWPHTFGFFFILHQNSSKQHI